MNCRAGDLAYVVRSYWPENVGVIVKVLRPFLGVFSPPEHAWIVEPTVPVVCQKGLINAGVECVIQDRLLRPIAGPTRDSIVEDADMLEALGDMAFEVEGPLGEPA